jgi:hypothetical protein
MEDRMENWVVGTTVWGKDIPSPVCLRMGNHVSGYSLSAVDGKSFSCQQRWSSTLAGPMNLDSKEEPGFNTKSEIYNLTTHLRQVNRASMYL